MLDFHQWRIHQLAAGIRHHNLDQKRHPESAQLSAEMDALKNRLSTIQGLISTSDQDALRLAHRRSWIEARKVLLGDVYVDGDDVNFRDTSNGGPAENPRPERRETPARDKRPRTDSDTDTPPLEKRARIGSERPDVYSCKSYTAYRSFGPTQP